MHRRTIFLALTLLWGALSGVSAQDWGEIANISSTMGVSGSRVCIGEASRGDIGCPGYAPSVSATTGHTTFNGGLTVNTVSLTTTGTTWGYLGSAASYLPNLNTNNISLSTINGVSVSNLGGSSPTDVPAFNVHKNSVDQTITANTWTKVTFSTKVLDTYSNFNTSTSRFTPTVAGNYIFQGSTRCGSSGTVSCWVAIFKNGVNISQNGSNNSATTNDHIPTTMTIIPMNGTTDYVELYIYSTITTVSGQTQFTLFSGSLLASGNGLVSGTGASALSGLSDVTLSSPSNGQVLTYNGSTWVNSSGASGDRLTSGTLSVTANSATSIVSLSTGATTWGYLGSNASYLPYLSGLGISATNISATTINGVAVSSLASASPTNVPSFRAHRNGTAQTIAAATWTKILFTHEDFDTYNNFDTTTSRFTPTVAGYYLVRGQSYCSTQTSCYTGIYKNGTQVTQSGSYVTSGSIRSLIPTIASVYMNGTTDYLELHAYTDGTSIAGPSAQTMFEANLIASGNGLISGTGASALSGLSDVTLSGPSNGQVLTYNGSTWVNSSGASGDRLTSGTLSVTANSATSVVSLTTGATTWGYLGSAASYVPNLSTNALSLGGFTLTSTSLVSSSAQVVFSAHRNSSAQTVTNNSYTKILFTTELYDTNNNYDPATGRFTATVAGKYQFNASTVCVGSSYCYIAMFKNGSGYLQSGSLSVYVSVNDVIDLAVGDYVEVNVLNSGGTSINGDVLYTRFSGALLNAATTSGSGSTATDRIVSGSTSVIAHTAGSVSINAPVGVSGRVSATTVQLSDSPADACNTGGYGTFKMVSGRPYVCRP